MEDNKGPNKSKGDYASLVEVDPTKINLKNIPLTLISNFISFIRGILSIKTGKISYN